MYTVSVCGNMFLCSEENDVFIRIKQQSHLVKNNNNNLLFL